ncbi:hypothetical protein MTR_0276s0020 [Medicago truncatula]|uniref:Uncharacterized protein n=1 Tax=Medicago truncatula TaxID=3880 RepID=A0A072TFQ3_MEDTR|nr:hypothetical protein MTR_0276s0020 [Medicago truncatula]
MVQGIGESTKTDVAIATIIHPNTVKNIKNVQLKLHCDVQDCFVWLGNLDGNYPASSDCIISAPKSVVTWHPSSIDRTVVIVDGNFILESGKSGYGIWISGFSGNLSNSNNIHAGIIVAILLGLCIIARRMNINHVSTLSFSIAESFVYINEPTKCRVGTITGANSASFMQENICTKQGSPCQVKVLLPQVAHCIHALCLEEIKVSNQGIKPFSQ